MITLDVAAPTQKATREEEVEVEDLVLPIIRTPRLLDDDNATVVYDGNWIIVTGNVSAGDFTQHQTNSPHASIFAPFYGGQITVVGTIPNGTGNVTASYSIDSAPPQSRSIQPNNGCDIPVAPFFTMSGLTEGSHNISIRVEHVGSRPYMFNFFALDPRESDIGTRASTPNSAVQGPEKLSVGEIARVAAAGFFLCIVLFLAYFAFRRMLDRLRRRKLTDRASDANLDDNDSVGSRSTLNLDGILDSSSLERAMTLSERGHNTKSLNNRL
ncbi:hypothetical protein SCHPADRAFT_890078 [Schizopora paradoxa]|uniref:Uncharacterized protein n=1 Tax=Schizopora paradoxa TaxID=27342 RepID=A0A0H2RN48_9AGAM|nr:hypothetical protein SCHPADRAFT_890078 [Schizopora paradoxa]